MPPGMRSRLASVCGLGSVSVMPSLRFVVTVQPVGGAVPIGSLSKSPLLHTPCVVELVSSLLEQAAVARTTARMPSCVQLTTFRVVWFDIAVPGCWHRPRRPITVVTYVGALESFWTRRSPTEDLARREIHS